MNKEFIDKGIDLVINTPTKGKMPNKFGFKLRRSVVEYNIPCYTSLDTVRIILRILKERGLKQRIYSIDYQVI